MLRPSLALLVVTGLFAGCDGGPVTPPLPSFFQDDFRALASSETAVYGRPVTIRVEVTPEYSGVGAFELDYISSGDSVVVQAPLRETLHAQRGRAFARHAVPFVAGEPVVVEWSLRLQGSSFTPHVFDVSAVADSIDLDGQRWLMSAETVADRLGPFSNTIRGLPVTFNPQRRSTGG